MTDEEALREAIRRWGSSGWVWRSHIAPNDVYHVGTEGEPGHPSDTDLVTKGFGSSWEEAFQRASKK